MDLDNSNETRRDLDDKLKRIGELEENEKRNKFEELK